MDEEAPRDRKRASRLQVPLAEIVHTAYMHGKIQPHFLVGEIIIGHGQVPKVIFGAIDIAKKYRIWIDVINGKSALAYFPRDQATAKGVWVASKW